MLTNRPCHGPWTGLIDSGTVWPILHLDKRTWKQQVSRRSTVHSQSETPRFYVSSVIFAMNGALMCYKTLKRMFCGAPPSDLSRNLDSDHRGVLTWIYDANLSSPVHGGNRSVFRRSQVMEFVLFDTIPVHIFTKNAILCKDTWSQQWIEDVP